MRRMEIREIGRTVAVKADLEDFDELAALATDWDLEFRQLDRGTSPVRLAQIRTERARLVRFRFERRYEQRGSSPHGVVTFGIPPQSGEPLRWRDEQAPSGSLVCFASGAEFAAVSRAGFAGTTVSFTADHLAGLADSLRLGEALSCADDLQLLTGRDPRQIGRLDRAVDRLLTVATKTETEQSLRRTAHLLEEEIPILLLKTLASGSAERPVRRPTTRARDRARRRALAFIEAHAHEAPSIGRICEAAGTSWRTLDYAFKEHFGVTPKAYLQAQRLHGVRRELRGVDTKAVIAEVAGRWGFWHMGQFAADYRRTFGELPSETLLR